MYQEIYPIPHPMCQIVLGLIKLILPCIIFSSHKIWVLFYILWINFVRSRPIGILFWGKSTPAPLLTNKSYGYMWITINIFHSISCSIFTREGGHKVLDSFVIYEPQYGPQWTIWTTIISLPNRHGRRATGHRTNELRRSDLPTWGPLPPAHYTSWVAELWGIAEYVNCNQSNTPVN